MKSENYQYVTTQMLFMQGILIRCWQNTQLMGKASRKYVDIILTPLKLHFCLVKLRFTGVYIIFLILLKNINVGTH